MFADRYRLCMFAYRYDLEFTYGPNVSIDILSLTDIFKIRRIGKLFPEISNI